MKTLLLTTSLFFLTNFLFAQKGLPAQPLLDSVLFKAAKEKKNVFVTFTASWCTPCKELKRGLHDPYISEYFKKNYVILELYSAETANKKINENIGAKDIIVKYDGDTSSLPYYIILNSSGKKLLDNYIKVNDSSDKRENIGYLPNPEYLKIFISFLKKTSKLNKQELQIIYDRLHELRKKTILDYDE